MEEEKHFKTSLPTINLVYAGAGEGRKGEREGRRKKEGIAAAHWFAGTGRDGSWMCPNSST